MEKVRVGIIGVGNMGSVHAKHIAVDGSCPELELTAIADIKESRREWAKETLPESVTVFDDAVEMLDSGLIDACIVAIPHYYHAEYSIECMKRGIHVMCEKPAGVYTKQVREMIAESKKHPEVVFGMMFNQRTNCIYRKMRELVQSGKYGEIRRTNWLITNWYRSQMYYNSGDWRATWSGEGGGVLLNQCPHNLDLWQWICGMPVKVSAKLHYGKWHDIEVEDDVTAYVEYENGATGTFITSTGDPFGTNRFEVQMDGAKIVAEMDDGQPARLLIVEGEMTEQEFVSNPDNFTEDVFAVVPRGPIHEVETDGENRQHNAVLNAWAGNILHGTPLVAEGAEGINGLTLSNAMHLSSFLNKEITLPLDEDLFAEELRKRVATSRRKENVKEVVSSAENGIAK